MPVPRPLRADVWREGEYIDLWSVPHLLSGVAVGFGLAILQINILAAFIVAFSLFALFKVSEMLLEVPGTSMNRFLDVATSMIGFQIAYFFAPQFSRYELHVLFGVVAIETLVFVVIGIRASRQAIAQEDMLHEEVTQERGWIKRQRRMLGARLFEARDRIREEKRKKEDSL